MTLGLKGLKELYDNVEKFGHLVDLNSVSKLFSELAFKV